MHDAQAPVPTAAFTQIRARGYQNPKAYGPVEPKDRTIDERMLGHRACKVYGGSEEITWKTLKKLVAS